MKIAHSFTSLLLAAGAFLGSCGVARASQRGYYSFDNNTVQDSSGNGFNGNVVGATAFADGKVGRAFSFNGNTNIQLTTTNNLGLIGRSFTVDAWVNFADVAASNSAVFGTGGSTPDRGLQMSEKGGKAFFGFFADDTAGNATLPSNTWINMAFVFDGANGTQSIYLNGTLDISSTGHNQFAGQEQTANIGGDCCGDLMHGLIDEVRVYNTALSESEIQLLVDPWRIADVNNDGNVTVGDLGILATHFNQTLAGGRSVEDLNSDGSVTVGDLGILATYFNQPAASSSVQTFDEAVRAFPNLPQSSVPEPTCAFALMLIALPSCRSRRG